ncbi:MAG: hypothetical protein V3U76_09495 [Granulosicoccus sp.]
MLFNPILANRPPSGFTRRWFSSHGVLLAIDTDAREFTRKIPDIHDALLLEKQEPLLHCVEHWLGSEFDWRPCEAATDDNLDITLTNRIGKKRQLGLALQTDQVANLPNVSADVAEMVCVARHAMTLSIELDSFELSEEDRQRLAVDSLVLLPGSFARQWQAKAGLDTDPDFSLRVTLDAGNGTMSYDADDLSMYDFLFKKNNDKGVEGVEGVEGVSIQPFRLSIVLDRRMDIIRGQSASTDNSSGFECKHQLENLQSGKVSVLADNGIVLFYGSLLRVGNGFAVKLEAAE